MAENHGEVFLTKKKVDTLIISDVHLRSRVCRAHALLAVLSEFEIKRLIVNGDFFDQPQGRLPRSHRQVIAYIHELEHAGCEVIFIDGNHDPNSITPQEHYLWQYNDETYLAIHGHQFYKIHDENAFISNLGDIVYRCAQILLTHERNFTRTIKYRNKKWLAASEVIAAGAAAYAHALHAQHVFCGHTHRALRRDFPEIGVVYYNSGCFTDIPATYITISEKGVETHEYF